MAIGEFAGARRREWYEQTVCYLREYTNGHRDWRAEHNIVRAMELPRLPARRRHDEVWAVSLVRDEIDVIGFTIDHMLGQGVDHVLIADHMSTDGTRDYLFALSERDPRVHVALASGSGHFQMERITRLSRAAWASGAAWVIPFDADEFWFAKGALLGDFLRTQDASVVRANSVNLLPAEDGPIGQDSGFLADISRKSASKVAFRAHRLALVGPGNHGVARVGEQCDGLFIAHVPYRGPEQISRKYRNGARALDAAAAPSFEGWHWRVGATMTDRDVERTWLRMRAGESIPEIGWTGVNAAVHVRALQWDSWDPDGRLR